MAVAGPEGEAQYKAAIQAVQAGNLEESLGQFEAALQADPDNIQYGSDYRQTVIKLKAYDRSIAFFEKLVAANPNAPYAFLNFGFSYVDKIPDAGAITQVLNANTALTYFTKSLEIKPSWIGYYTRGNSYLFWPKIFNRTQFGIDDLEAALKLQAQTEKRPYYVRAYVSLGDGYYKLENVAKAREVWQEGLKLFPDDEILKKRVNASDVELESIVKTAYDPNVRVSTDLSEIWAD